MRNHQWQQNPDEISASAARRRVLVLVLHWPESNLIRVRAELNANAPPLHSSHKSPFFLSCLNSHRFHLNSPLASIACC